MAETFSYLTPAGYQQSSCGYCHSKPARTRQHSSSSYGATSSSVKPEHYQLLIDRGWRRSGTYYYKPDNRHHCCPHYTIRLDAKAFDSRKDQRKALNRWNQYVLGLEYKTKAARFCPATPEEKRRRKNTFDLHESLHKSEYAYVNRPIDTTTKASIEPAHKFEVTLEPDHLTDEKYALYDHYQKFVHKDKNTYKSGFKRFLCSGIGQKTVQLNGKAKRLGSYHQCYRLDGRLVAIGVLDLLPDCVSSVYLIYHEDVNEWQFGKISAMREIQLAIEEGCAYYYMGYYIHSCVKMRYKGSFRPSNILDPISYTWDPLDSDLFQRLSARRFVSLSLDRRLRVPASADALSHLLKSALQDSPHLYEPLKVGNVTYPRAIDYLEDDKKESKEQPHRGVFDSGMPGVMALDELETDMNLGAWLVQLGDQIVKLEHLTAWEGDISDPDCIKGLIAQLAACLGPDLMHVFIVSFAFS